MTFSRYALLSLCAFTLLLPACETAQTNVGTKQAVGTVGGALVGGILGSQIGGGSGKLWATGAGAVLGALAGSEIGRSLDKADLAYAEKANAQAYNAPIGQEITWNNPQSGNYGTVKSVQDGRSSSGQYCREYQQTIVVGGKKQSGYGTACQRSDGSWEVVN